MNEAGISVSTVEHLLSALAGCGVHNARIEINGPEVPILDGSAVPFVHQILADPLTQLDQPVEAIRILKDIEFKTDPDIDGLSDPETDGGKGTSGSETTAGPNDQRLGGPEPAAEF